MILNTKYYIFALICICAVVVGGWTNDYFVSDDDLISFGTSSIYSNYGVVECSPPLFFCRVSPATSVGDLKMAKYCDVVRDVNCVESDCRNYQMYKGVILGLNSIGGGLTLFSVYDQYIATLDNKYN